MELNELLEELRGETCRCGKKKVSMQTLCRKDYMSLPPGMRQALYRRVGAGYEEAYEAACEYLDDKAA